MEKTKSTGRLITDKDEIDLLVLLRLLWKHKVIIALATIAALLCAYAGTLFLIAPTYESQFTVFVNNKSDTSTTTEVTQQDTSAASSLAQTYAEIMQSSPLISKAADKLGISEDDVENYEVTASIQTNTQLVNVNIQTGSAKNAYEFAKAMAEIAPDYLANIVDGTSMKIVTKPKLEEQQIAPSPLKNAAIGAVVGFIIAICIIVIIEVRDTRIKSKEELEKTFGYSVMGDIPVFSTEE